MKKVLLYLLIFIGGLLMVPQFPANAQISCPVGTQVEGGLITANEPISGTFGNITGTCIANNEAQFTFTKIPTYDNLLIQFFTKAKSPTTTVSGDPTDATEANLTFNIYPLVRVTGDLTLGAGASSTGNPPTSATGPGVVFVDGNLNITKDYTYGEDSPNDSYGTVFVVKGDVVIETLVREVNAVIISEGIIYTASDPGTGGHCDTSTVATSRQLIINGSLISIKDEANKDPLNENPVTVEIKFCRVLVPNTNNALASEKINLQPKYLSILRNIFATSIQKWAEIPGFSITAGGAAAAPPTEPEPDPEPVKFPKRIFVTSNTYAGNLGGLAGADRKCQVAANAIPALATSGWRAWLSASTVDAASRFNYATSTNIDFRLVDNTVVADSWSDLTDGTLINFINKDQNGNTIPNSGVWTNTTPAGGIVSATTSCSDWTSASAAVRGGYGNNSYKNAYWTQTLSSLECSINVFRLYCLENGVAPAEPRNLLLNPGFESPFSQNPLFPDWVCQGAPDPYGSGTCVIDTTVKNGGNSSVRVTNTAPSSPNNWGWQVAQNPNVTADPNELFCLSVDVKKQNANDGVSIALQRASTPWSAVLISPANNTSWQTLKQEIYRPAGWGAGPIAIQVYFRSTTTNTPVWFDDVSLTRGTCD